MFYIKKDYEKYDDISADELEAAQRESDDLFNSMNGWIDTQKSRQGKKTLKEKRDDLFGGGKESMEQFKTLLCNEIRRVAPRFERTTIVEVRDIPMHTLDGRKVMLIIMVLAGRCPNTFKT